MPGVVVRRAKEGERDAIEASYARAAARKHGWLVRPRAFWDRRFASDRRTWLVAARGAEIAGHVAWTLDQRVPHASVRLVVDELCASDDDAKRALLGAIGATRDQVHDVHLETDARNPIAHALLDADRARFGDSEVEHPLGSVVGGPMVRVTDVRRAVAARARDASAPFAIDVDGARVDVGDQDADAAGVVATDRATLGAILFGGLSVRDACALGLARGAPEAVARADAAFASPPFFALDPF